MYGISRIPQDRLVGTGVCGEFGTIPFGCMPFIVCGAIESWKARDWCCESLAESYPSELVECFVTEHDNQYFLKRNAKRYRCNFEEAMEKVSEPDGKTRTSVRVDKSSNPILFKHLLRDCQIPLQNMAMFSYNESATGVWFGEEGNVTPFHHDWWHSCLIQVSGYKYFVLIHPFEVPRMQDDFGWTDAQRFELEAVPYIEPPYFRDYETAICGIVNAGEILYIPPFWWHQVKTAIDGNISIVNRYDTEQSADVEFFQLSQKSALRRLTKFGGSEKEPLQECTERFADLVERFQKAYHDYPGSGYER